MVFNDAAARDLQSLAINGLVALHGIETGGLLLGETQDGELHIDAFQEVRCEHRYGPSYTLSESDRARLRELLRGRRDATPHVVGFFRSFNSRDPVIEYADEAFVREYFPQGDLAYLMVRPHSAEDCAASLYFFRDGRLLPAAGNFQFAFDTRQAPAVQPRPDLPPTHRTAHEDTPVFIAELTPRPARWWIMLAVCLILGAVAGAIYQFGSTSMPRERVQWTELQLDARPVGGHIEISWDSAAAGALDPTKAVMAVTDGDTRRDIELGPDEIRAGKYRYTPSHPDVAVRLTLYANDRGVAGESVRLASRPNQGPNPPAKTRLAVAAQTDSALPAPAERVAVPPSSLHEVQPTIPDGIRSRITEEVVIPVQVQVSERGQVVSTRADDQTDDGIHRYLAAEAQKAAREWRFSPARTRSGAPIAASRTIQFVFTP